MVACHLRQFLHKNVLSVLHQVLFTKKFHAFTLGDFLSLQQVLLLRIHPAWGDTAMNEPSEDGKMGLRHCKIEAVIRAFIWGCYQRVVLTVQTQVIYVFRPGLLHSWLENSHPQELKIFLRNWVDTDITTAPLRGIVRHLWTRTRTSSTLP